jgi:hypothetical protein
MEDEMAEIQQLAQMKEQGILTKRSSQRRRSRSSESRSTGSGTHPKRMMPAAFAGLAFGLQERLSEGERDGAEEQLGDRFHDDRGDPADD